MTIKDEEIPEEPLDEDGFDAMDVPVPMAEAVSGQVIVIHPILPADRKNARSPEAQLEEAVGLADAITLNVVYANTIKVSHPTSALLLGTGAADALAALVAEKQADLVIIDYALSPVQQRNLERTLKAKVIDRTGLILEIFGERARTGEGQLQVELAALTYQRSRLVRSWTHLERQRGGFGFMGGPGESQLEMDRRLIDNRIIKLKKDLAEVRRTRQLHRKARAKVPYPVVALVGYTNAGKSTLFNRLAGAEMFVKDLLFATLDTTMRAVPLPSGRKIILSDTVGFISDLPTHLVEAFRATLEEVESADIILHVRDIAHPDSKAQKADVEAVLLDLGIDAEKDPRVIEVMNKIDLVADEDEKAIIINRAVRHPAAVAISAVSGFGLDRLTDVLDARATAHRQVANLSVSNADGAALAWLYGHGEVMAREDDETHVHLKVAIDPVDLARFQSQFCPPSH